MKSLSCCCQASTWNFHPNYQKLVTMFPEWKQTCRCFKNLNIPVERSERENKERKPMRIYNLNYNATSRYFIVATKTSDPKGNVIILTVLSGDSKTKFLSFEYSGITYLQVKIGALWWSMFKLHSRAFIS